MLAAFRPLTPADAGFDSTAIMPHDGMNHPRERTMLKEVGASGQISLGKKYAGQLFDVQTAANGTITLLPVKVVPLAQEEAPAYLAASSTSPTWSDDNASRIAQYNAWAAERQPYSQRVRQWRAAKK